MPLLSVVTVVRNDEEGLSRTLASLAAQGLPPDEIVVLDGSDDDSIAAQVIDDFDTLPVALSWQPPEGIYPAMNAALALVHGDYVYFLNAGDELADPGVLERTAQALREEQPVWAVGRACFVQPDGRAVPEPMWTYSAERRRLFARGRFPAHQAVIARVSALRDLGGFDTSYRIAADYHMSLRLALISAPMMLPFTVARFSVGGASTTHWRTGLREFHRARREVFQPRGATAVIESADTIRQAAATAAYRTLWSPGRPLSAVADRRGRGG